MRIAIHIGYHKTGSTFLQKIIFPNHPNIKLVNRHRVQESLLLVDSFSFNPEKLRAWIREEMMQASSQQDLLMLSDEELSGNIHTGGNGGYLAKEIADRLYSSLPDAHILIFIRNQYDMIDSVYRQYVKEGGTFRIEKYLLDNNGLNHRFPQFSFNHFEYDKLISYYLSLFGQDKVHVFLYEFMQHDVKNFLQVLFKVLGVPPLPDLEKLSQKRINRRFSTISISLARITNKLYGSDPINRRAILDIPIVFKGFVKFYQLIDRTALIKYLDNNRSLLNNELEKIISNHYSQSNLKLSRMLGIDLRSFGYPMEEDVKLSNSTNKSTSRFGSILSR